MWHLFPNRFVTTSHHTKTLLVRLLLIILWNHCNTTVTRKHPLFATTTYALTINELTYRPPYIPELETSTTTRTTILSEVIITSPFTMPKRLPNKEVTNPIISSKCQCGSFEIQLPVSSVTSSSCDAIVDESVTAAMAMAVTGSTTAAADCHCPSCRRYHVAAFASYVQVRKRDVTVLDHSDTKTSLGSYRDYCTGAFGVPGASSMPVNRIYCTHCSTKMYTEPLTKTSTSTTTDGDDILLVNMGPLRDTTIPIHISNQWKKQKPTIQPLAASPDTMEERIERSRFGRVQWKVSETTAWTWALPQYKTSNNDDDDDNDEEEDADEEEIDDVDDDEAPARYDRNVDIVPLSDEKLLVLQGGCTCGSCRYKIRFRSPSELQHCYCRLCRRLSGSAFMTWIPIQLIDFHWTSMIPSSSLSNNSMMMNARHIDGAHILKRYTDMGQRHVCPDCHGVLTIVYDDDADVVVWIAAGTLDTIHLPAAYQALDKYLDRVVHICCQSKQSWYTLPNDGLVRLNSAS